MSKASLYVILLLLVIVWFSFPASAQELPDAPSASRLTLTHNTVLDIKMAPVKTKRSKSGLAVLVSAIGFAVAADVYDVTETEKGLKAGVSVEGNSFLVGPKPSAGALYARDLPIIAAVSVPSILGYIYKSNMWLYSGLVGPGAAGVKHIQGGRQWAALLAGNPPTQSELTNTRGKQ